MANLKTTYLGLELNSPLVVGASSLSSDPDKVKELEDAGAGAIVFKSLFEEQIQLEELELMSALEEYEERNAEMTRLFPSLKHAGPKEYLLRLKKAKSNLSIPLIASLNAMHDDTWIDWAKQIEETGVDALELNFFTTPRDFEMTGSDIIQKQIDTLKSVRSYVKIPIAVKLSSFYTNPLSVINRMDLEKINGFVLFNKMFQPDIDIEKEQLEQSIILSNSYDVRLAIRFAGLLYGNIHSDISSAGGIINGTDAIKTILAGASTFQVVSTLYQNGVGQIPIILSEIEKWMDSKGYKSIDEFKGKLSRKYMKDPFAYRRSQYVDIIMRSEEILKNKALI
ncbi:MAG TPA: dihydroorotate dehydrogenase-like protein [Tenuifilaceae bacterium]|nr:dihydroorotate dehydrogenase-like protein [Tenuifilaceae bacterium]HPE17948.1 dihydroorotate dehydrogenase-like protein [Tenuifilaceae bacterium]HPJ45379.1 dihydroorotate dehydrogenase-like protein [Tenuifilaceae bacterium]HPQ33240.1 dihydroorotate dehydrogenase-like protein [Tenuifilaceae bacterium]HRX67928.1 dihydroorotate dehydrogenase-like protein [Tenuifilaceae bacterium]